MKRSLALAAALPLALTAFAAQTPKPKSGVQPRTPPAGVVAYLKANCYSCHTGKDGSGHLDLTTLAFDFNDKDALRKWIAVHDRVRDGEMPPKGTPRPPAAVTNNFLKGIATPLMDADEARTKQYGRSVWRRMNRYEYENTLRDLLDSPWIQVRELLPEDGEAFRFNKVGEALDVSYVQMSRYLTAAEYSLREAMAPRAERPAATTQRYYARDQRSFAGLADKGNISGSPERAMFPILGNAADRNVIEKEGAFTAGENDPIRRELEALGMVCSSYEPIEPKFDRFHAPVSGLYKIRVSAYSYWAGPESEKRWWRPSKTDVSVGRTVEPVTLYSELPPRQLRKLCSFDARPLKGNNTSPEFEVEVYLRKGETIRPDPVRFFRSRPPAWRNPLATEQGQPGVAFRWMEVSGPNFEPWPGKGHRLIFGDLPLQANQNKEVEAVSTNPDGDSARLLRQFITRAYRRPVTDADIAPFVKLAKTARESGLSFTDAQITACSAVLCSPSFVTLEEKPGLLDDYALASRLSYFLWNSEPDTTLRTLAQQGELKKPGVLRAQAQRLLADPRSARFVEGFLDYWLDLRKANNVSPDEILYPDYYLDDFLVESAVDETQAFFTELLQKNLPARNLVDSDFVTVNGRLAELYGLEGVDGATVRHVPLPTGSVRGGLLTQASILKVTANGTNTSPVVRGAWITERILGKTVPPPPAAVPAVEPDTRGATTIREQLAKHRNDATCNACHAKIDPAGFALENFDVVGGWRECYRALGKEAKLPGRGKNGQPFTFGAGPTVDATGVLPNGRKFNDVRELKRLLASDERQLARNLARQLTIYGTGAPVRFGDRAKIEAILDRAQSGKYGVKSILFALIGSDLFRSK